MSAKDSIATQTCELSKEEFNDFLTLYPIPSEYRVILPKSNQTIFDALPGYVGLYTHSFSLANLRLPLTEFFCEVLEYFQVTVDSGESPKPELFVVHPGSVGARIKDRKCKTRGGSSRPPIKRKLAPGSSTSRATRAKTSSSKEDVPFLAVSNDDEGLSNVLELKEATACHLKISAITPPSWKNHLDNLMDLEFLDLHDHCYARQAAVDNAVNRRSRELLQVIEKLRGEFDVIRSMERGREEECEGLRVKCEAAMTEFEKNPAVVALREKISALSTESKVTSFEAQNARLEAIEVSLRKEVKELKQDRREVVSKFVPYAAKELVHIDDKGSLVGKLVSSAIMYGRCRAFEQVSDMKEPFYLSKLDKFMADTSAPIEALLLKKPPTLQRPAPSRTKVPLPSSQRATPSSVPVSNLMSPTANAFVVKPQSSQLY
ncbi:hypothetical protein Tco_0422246 [Tanacetum coccineum]